MSESGGGERAAVLATRVRVEPVAVDPGEVRGGAREARLDEGEVRRERGAIRGVANVRVEVRHLPREVRRDAPRRDRAVVVALAVLVLALDAADDVRALVEGGERAGGRRVRRAAILRGETKVRQAEVRLHGDALGGEARQTPRARPAVEDQVAVAVRGRHRRGSMRRERTGDGGSEQGGTRERSRHASTALLEVRKLAVASPSSRKRKVPAGEDLRFG